MGKNKNKPPLKYECGTWTPGQCLFNQKVANDVLEVPCPVCCRTGFLIPVGPASINVTDPCRTCGSTGWIMVDKYKYLRGR